MTRMTKIEASINGNRAFYTTSEIIENTSEFLKFKDLYGNLITLNKRHLDRMWEVDV